MQILPIDIETAPMESYHWQPKTDYIGHTMNKQCTTIICVSYRDPRNKRLVTISIDPRQPRNDKALCGKLSKLLLWCAEENVILLHQNGDRFDIPKIESRFIYYRLPPLPRMVSIDMYRESKKFGHDYQGLDYKDKHFNGVGKVEHRGFAMWREIIDTSFPLKVRKKSLADMIHYCEGDIVALERDYETHKPYIKIHPNVNLWKGTTHCCPTCGSPKIIYRGKPAFTPTRAYRRMSCKKCLRWFRETKSMKEYKQEVTNRL